ncbi:MAG: hypothetical protein IPK19_01250 [Chloroflexi bacterium]|nr:hypothetical protein [Chloroflexota bacterium]
MRRQPFGTSSSLIFPLLSTLAFGLTLIFTLLRIATPSDGARLMLGPDITRADALVLFPDIETTDGLQGGDQIIRVAGRPMIEWLDGLMGPSMADAGWQRGDLIDYTVLRSGEERQIPVTIGAFSFDLMVARYFPVALFLILIQVQAIWLWWRRPREQATQTLLLAATAFVTFSVSRAVGADLAMIVNNHGLFVYYRAITFIFLMLMAAALFHFAIVLPGPRASAQYPIRFITLLYLTPYPAAVAILLFNNNPDPLAMLRTWELTGLVLLMMAFLLTLVALAAGYRRITTPFLRQRVRLVAITFAMAMGFTTLLVILPALLQGQLVLSWEIVPLLSFPIALGIAFSVVRYRLFNIRIAIQRTLVWGTLTMLIVSVYIVVVGSLSAVFQNWGSTLFSLIGTGIAAVVFASVRTRLQNAVNLLIYGERDAPEIVMVRLTRRLEQTLAPDDALEQIAQTVATALKLPYAAVELGRDGDHVRLASWGEPQLERIEFPLTYGGETVGRLVVAPRSPGEALTPATVSWSTACSSMPRR